MIGRPEFECQACDHVGTDFHFTYNARADTWSDIICTHCYGTGVLVSEPEGLSMQPETNTEEFLRELVDEQQRKFVTSKPFLARTNESIARELQGVIFDNPDPFLYGADGEAHDPVNHPSHYTNHPSGVECIQITEHMGFCLGNAVKYIWRADLKNGVEDLRKAKWYIEREIARRTDEAGK